MSMLGVAYDAQEILEEPTSAPCLLYTVTIHELWYPRE